MAHKDYRDIVRPLAERLAQDMGYELVDVELVKEGPGRYLRIYLDKEGGFALDDCERFHKAIQPQLEAVDYDFLEVSSPGLDRPLKTPRDWDRAMGEEIEIRLYKPLDGKKTYRGILTGYDEDELVVMLPEGECAIARSAVALAKPVIHFDEDEEDGGEDWA